jgi:uncharacterized protein (DUF433 family)
MPQARSLHGPRTPAWFCCTGMDWQSRISVDPKVLVGKPVVKGTRIAAEFVVDLLARGWTTQQILHEYDHLTREDI